MRELENSIDTLVNKILLKAENQHELLFGVCESGVKLTNTQEHILMLLSQERLTNSDLAKKLNVSQAAITKAIKSLLARDLLAAKKDTVDARVTYFELTESAKPIASEHSHHHTKTLSVYRSLIDEFSDADQEVIERFLDSFSKKLEGEI